MKKRSIVFSLCILAITAGAQESNQSSSLVPAVKKNEVYVNVIPVLKVFMDDAYSGNNRFSVMYKRGLNEKSALRFSIMLDVINGTSYYNTYYPIANTLHSNTDLDSISLTKDNHSPGYNNTYINIGYERIFGKHKLKWFYGSDLSFGYSERRTYSSYYIYYKISSMPDGATYAFNHETGSSISFQSKSYSIGLSPFFGAKYPISKRFLIAAQVGLDVACEMGTNTFSDIAGTRTFRYTTYNFGTHMGFLNDVSLVYTF